MSRNPANCQILLDPLKDGAGLFGCELVIDDSELLNQDANTRRHGVVPCDPCSITYIRNK
jgi:hypothetical protein